MKTLMIAVASLAVAGCGATTPIPADKLTRAQERVRVVGSEAAVRAGATIHCLVENDVGMRRCGARRRLNLSSAIRTS